MRMAVDSLDVIVMPEIDLEQWSGKGSLNSKSHNRILGPRKMILTLPYPVLASLISVSHQPSARSLHRHICSLDGQATMVVIGTRIVSGDFGLTSSGSFSTSLGAAFATLTPTTRQVLGLEIARSLHERSQPWTQFSTWQHQ